MINNKIKKCIILILTVISVLTLYKICYATSELVLLVEKNSWQIVCLVSVIVFLFLQRKPMGVFIENISKLAFEKTKGRTRLVVTSNSEIEDTLPLEIKTTTQEMSHKFEKLLKDKKYSDIEKECSILKKEETSSILPHIYLGRSLIIQGKFDEANIEFQKALAINDNDSDVYYYLGILQQRKNSLNTSVDYIKTAYRLKNNDPKITLNLGYLYFYFYRDVNEAIKYLRKSHDDYRKTPIHLDLGEEYNITIHNSLEYYLASRGKKDDFKQAFDIDKYIASKYEHLVIVDKSRILDTRGFLRYNAIKKGFISTNKEETLIESINFLTDACSTNISYLEASQHIVEALLLQRKSRNV